MSVVLVTTEALPQVAALMRGSFPLAGLVILLVMSVLIGMGYGLLFAHESPDAGSGMAWGMLYGLTWWFGPLTLMPILLGHAPPWTMQAADVLLPSLVSYVIYGAATGLVFFWFDVIMHNGCSLISGSQRVKHIPSLAWNSAPALWLVVLGLGIVLPIVLG